MNEELNKTAALDLKALRAAADAAVDAAYHVEWTSTCVNWGDLCCVQAEHWVDEEGGEGYRVYIEEAAPDNQEFCGWIAKQLEAAGFPGVEVITEW